MQPRRRSRRSLLGLLLTVATAAAADEPSSYCWVPNPGVTGVDFPSSLGWQMTSNVHPGPPPSRGSCLSLDACFQFIADGYSRYSVPPVGSFQQWGFTFNMEAHPGVFDAPAVSKVGAPHDCQYHPELSFPFGERWAYCGFGFEYWSTQLRPGPPGPYDDPRFYTPFTGSSHGDARYAVQCSATSCTPGFTLWGATARKCTRYRDVYERPQVCPAVGDLNPLSGLLRQSVPSDFELGSNLITLNYDDAADPDFSPPIDEAGDLGDKWFISTHRRAVRAGLNTTLVRGDGELVVFNEPDAGVQTARTSSGHVDSLVVTPRGLLYRNQRDQTLETYDSSGAVTGWMTREGRRFIVTVDAGVLLSVRDDTGRGLEFSYRPGTRLRPLLERITADDGASLTATYERDQLVRLTRGDGTSRQFGYAGNNGRRLTQLIDELDGGYASFGYSGDQLASSARGDGVERHTATAQRPPRPIVREVYDAQLDLVTRYHEWEMPVGSSVALPNGSTTQYAFTAIAPTANGLSRVRLSSVSQPAGAGCGPASSHLEYDANGNVRSRDDFNGHRVCYAHDSRRNLELVRVEGLAGGTACAPLLAPGATLPSGARKIVTEWHPDWDVAVRRSEPGKVTRWFFNGQPDLQNITVSCAPPTALLPDGQPIAVLCQLVEQATTDLTGADGLGATLENRPVRRVSYTYDASGRVLTEDGPRTDVNDVTTSTYHDASSPNARPGDLKSITDALGKTTRFTRYDAAGRLLETIAPNGLVTTYSYDTRGLRRSTTVGTRTTTVTYDAAGQPIRVTRPDRSWETASYDRAHRLIGTTDSRGTSVELRLDDASNVTSRLVRSGAVVRQETSWFYDALGRVSRAVFGSSTPTPTNVDGGIAGGSAAGGLAGGGSTSGGAAGGGSAGGNGGTSGGTAMLSCSSAPTNRRDAVCQRWRCDRQDLAAGTWTGSTAQCQPGDRPEARASALKLMNLYRFLADLPPVATSQERNDGAQECALMMTANNAINFSPPSTWACYSQRGATAASQSVMCNGTTAARCIDLQMSAFGQTTSNTLGTRRWVLSNDLGAVGIGSTSSVTCEWLIGSGGNAGKPWIAWPPPGPVPLAALRIPGDQSIDQIGWSIQGATANVTNATVTVTDSGQPLPVTVSNLLAFYGSPSALKFVPNGWAVQAGHTYEVTVSGGSLTTPIRYSVEVVDCL